MEAYTDSIEAAKNRVANAVEGWALSLNQGEVIKWFYNSIASLAENIDKLILVFGSFAALTNFSKVISTFGNGLSVLGVRMGQIGQIFVPKSEYKNVGVRQAIKDNLQLSFLLNQSKIYNSSLASTFNSTQKNLDEYKTKAFDLQNYLIENSKDFQVTNQNKEKRSLLADNILAIAKGEETNNIYEGIETDKILQKYTDLLSISEKEQYKQSLKNLSQDEIRAKVTKDYNDKLREMTNGLSEETVEMAGENGNQASKKGMYSSMVSGAFALGYGILGNSAGKGLGQIMGKEDNTIINSLFSIFSSWTGSKMGDIVGGAIDAGIDAKENKLNEGLSFLGDQFSSAGGVVSMFGTALTVGLAIWNRYQEKLLESLKELTEAYANAALEFNNKLSTLTTAAKLDKLNNGVDYLGRNVSLSDDDYSKYLEYSNLLAEVFPNLIQYTDEAGNKIVGFGSACGDITDYIEELIEKSRNETDKAYTENDKHGQSVFLSDFEKNLDLINDSKEDEESDLNQATSDYMKKLKKTNVDDYVFVEGVGNVPSKGTYGFDLSDEKIKEQYDDFVKKLEDSGSYTSKLIEQAKANAFKSQSNPAYKAIENYFENLYKDSAEYKTIQNDYDIKRRGYELEQSLNYQTYLRAVAIGEGTKRYDETLENNIQNSVSTMLDNMDAAQNLIYQSILGKIDSTLFGEGKTGLYNLKIYLENTAVELADLFKEFDSLSLIALSNGVIDFSDAVAMSFNDFANYSDYKEVADKQKEFLFLQFGSDTSKWTDAQIDIAAALSFEVDGNGGLKDLDDVFELIQNYFTNKLLEIPSYVEGLKYFSGSTMADIYNLIGEGWFNEDSGDEVYTYVKNNLEPITLEKKQQRARDYISNLAPENNEHDGTIARITNYLSKVKSGDVIDKTKIALEFADLPSNIWELIYDSAVEISELTEAQINENSVLLANIIKKSTDAAIAQGTSYLVSVAKDYNEKMFSDLDLGTDGIISTAEEWVNAITSMTDAMNLLIQAEQEVADNGEVSWKTAEELIASNPDYADLLNFNENGTITVKTDANGQMIDMQKEAAKSNLEASIALNEDRVEEIKTEKADLEAKLNALEDGTYQIASNEATEATNAAAQENTALTLIGQTLEINTLKAQKMWAALRGASVGELAGFDEQILVLLSKTSVQIATEAQNEFFNGISVQSEEMKDALIAETQTLIDSLNTETSNLEKSYERLLWYNEHFDDVNETNYGSKVDTALNKIEESTKALDKLKAKLSAVNKEFYQMYQYGKNFGLGQGQTGDYYVDMKKNLTDIIALLQQKLATELASNGATEQYYEYLQEILEYMVQRENLDDEEAEDKISIMESQGLINDKLISAYKTLVSTADTEAEYYEYQSRLNEKIKEQKELLYSTLQYQKELLDTMLEYEKSTATTDRYNSLTSQMESNLRQQMLNAADRASTAYSNLYYAAKNQGYSDSEAKEQASQNSDYQGAVKEYVEAFKSLGEVIVQAFEDKVAELQKKIDDMGDSKAKEWTSVEQIDDYYKNLDKLYNYILEQAEVTLQNIDGLTDEEIQDIVDNANDAIKNINDNMIDMYSDIKDYQEDIYSALKNEVDRYKEQLESQKSIIEEVYDKEIEKLTDKQQSIERTNRLLEILNNLETAQEEKQKVYRAGIGWTFESDKSKIKAAEKELKNFQLQDLIDDLNNAKDAELKVLDERISNWDDYLKQLEEKYSEYDTLQEQKLLRELLGIETQEALEQRIKEDMDSFISYIDNNQTSLMESMSDTYLAFGSTFDGFLDGYKENLETLDYYNTRTLDLLSASDYNATNGSELLQYLDESKLTDEQKAMVYSSVTKTPEWQDVDYYGTSGGDYSRKSYSYNTNADSSVVLAAQQYLKGKYLDSILTDGKLGDQTISAIMLAAALGDAKAQTYAQQLGIDYNGYTNPGNYGSSYVNSNGKTITYNYDSGNKDVSSYGAINSNGRSANYNNGGFSTNDVLAAQKEYNRTHPDSQIKEDGKWGSETSNAFNGLSAAQYLGKSSGILSGPVTYTGLTMLHGSPSSPEYVLNSDQAYSLLRYMATTKPEFTSNSDSGNITYSYGDIIMNGVNDPETFFSELTNAMDRKYSTTKNRR